MGTLDGFKGPDHRHSSLCLGVAELLFEGVSITIGKQRRDSYAINFFS
jgi:hypothetical protein